MDNYLKRLDKAIEKATNAVENAKQLTTKDRKKLRKTTFCGPGKSFPVPDCKHVAVAKAYLAKSKFSKSTKKKIAACINKKAKSLKCDVSKKAKAYTTYAYESLTKEQQELYDSDVFKTTRDLVESSIEDYNETIKET